MDQITTVQALPSAQTEDWQEQYAYSLGLQAYIYGFPWIYNAQLRWLWATPEGQRVSVEVGKPDLYAPINFFHCSPQLANPASYPKDPRKLDTFRHLGESSSLIDALITDLKNAR